ncbi:hypothetical protein F383_04102 [Gossypium arboreum]|uniref:Uncharacterized protein n=1 Tax=Gossypium arboreum TaxID=29729 RepID=A0A0B0P0Q0_GOSAR|nr:hypothetical protein F383_04102 [Gossypium arboreum]
MYDCLRPWSSLPKGHGRVVCLCEEVQALLILYVGLFSPFLARFSLFFVLLCSPKYKT